METFIRGPAPLSGNGNVAANWLSWKRDFMIFMRAGNYNKRPNEVKAYLLKSHIGQVGLDAIEIMSFKNADDKDNINILFDKLDKHFAPPKNELVERYNFFIRHIKRNETLEDFISDLKEKAASCNFGKEKEKLIRDKVIADLKDASLRKKLFETENLTLDKLISISKEYKSAKTATATESINNNTKNVSERNQESRTRTATRRNCSKCDEKHPMRACPAWGFRCEKCNGQNHYTKCCPNGSKQNNQTHINNNKVNTNQNVFNPNRSVQPEHRKNYQQHYLESLGPPYNTSPNLQPSAPYLPADNNVLYPNLNHVRIPEIQSTSREWSWIEQRNVISNENFQNTHTPSQPTNIGNIQTAVPKTETGATPIQPAESATDPEKTSTTGDTCTVS